MRLVFDKKTMREKLTEVTQFDKDLTYYVYKNCIVKKNFPHIKFTKKIAQADVIIVRGSLGFWRNIDIDDPSLGWYKNKLENLYKKQQALIGKKVIDPIFLTESDKIDKLDFDQAKRLKDLVSSDEKNATLGLTTLNSFAIEGNEPMFCYVLSHVHKRTFRRCAPRPLKYQIYKRYKLFT